jgi:hypothetical protein
MLPLLFDLICSAPRDQPHVQSFPSPALRKEREGQGTRSVADAGEIKSLGHPPSTNTRENMERSLRQDLKRLEVIWWGLLKIVE